MYPSCPARARTACCPLCAARAERLTRRLVSIPRGATPESLYRGAERPLRRISARLSSSSHRLTSATVHEWLAEGSEACGTIGCVIVRVRLFASYREAAGAPTVEVSLRDGDGGEALWAALVARYPTLGRLPVPSRYAINDEFVGGDTVLREHDEIALIPPVSGGTGPRPPLVEITAGPIVIDRILREVADPRAGAVVMFLGVVRDNARGRRVDALIYEAYESLARKEMEKIAAAIAERWPVTRVAMIHRTGQLVVGEASVAIGVSAPHRSAAFEAARFAIDTLKLAVPIWKKEIWEGGEAWVGADP